MLNQNDENNDNIPTFSKFISFVLNMSNILKTKKATTNHNVKQNEKAFSLQGKGIFKYNIALFSVPW